MVAVEAAWAGADLAVPDVDLETEPGGNPVIALVEALRAAYPDLDDLHAGLTSQDVLDTALVLMLRDAVTAVRGRVRSALDALGTLTTSYGEVPMTGRTLTRPALPITFGDKASAW